MVSENNSLDKKMKLLEFLSEETNFHIFTLLLIYKELTLTELAERMPKSRATIHRHLQNLVDSELIIVSKQKIIRGHIPANFYTPNMQKLYHIGQISQKDKENMTKDQERTFRRNIIQTNLSSCRLIQNNLRIAEDFLTQLDSNDENSFNQIFNLETSPLFLSFGLMTETQKELYLQEYMKFNQEFQKKIQEKQLIGLDEEKPHVNFFGFLPMKLLFDIMQKGKNETRKKK